MPYLPALIIDDEPEMRTLLKALLNTIEVDSYEAPSPENAKPLIENQQFSIVILDLMVGGENAVDFIANIKRSRCNRHTPVVVVSGTVELNDLNRAVHLGARKTFRKPLEQSKFLGDIWQILGSKQGEKALSPEQHFAYMKSGLGKLYAFYLDTDVTINQIPPFRDLPADTYTSIIALEGGDFSGSLMMCHQIGLLNAIISRSFGEEYADQAEFLQDTSGELINQAVGNLRNAYGEDNIQLSKDIQLPKTVLLSGSQTYATMFQERYSCQIIYKGFECVVDLAL